MSSTPIHNVRNFDGETLTIPNQNGYVLLTNTLITAVGTWPPPNLPPTATTTTMIDGGGNTILPGLIDAHVHVLGNEGGAEAELSQALAFGVTTVLDMFNEPDRVERLRGLVEGGFHLADL